MADLIRARIQHIRANVAGADEFTESEIRGMAINHVARIQVEKIMGLAPGAVMASAAELEFKDNFEAAKKRLSGTNTAGAIDLDKVAIRPLDDALIDEIKTVARELSHGVIEGYNDLSARDATAVELMVPAARRRALGDVLEGYLNMFQPGGAYALIFANPLEQQHWNFMVSLVQTLLERERGPHLQALYALKQLAKGHSSCEAVRAGAFSPKVVMCAFKNLAAHIQTGALLRNKARGILTVDNAMNGVLQTGDAALDKLMAKHLKVAAAEVIKAGKQDLSMVPAKDVIGLSTQAARLRKDVERLQKENKSLRESDKKRPHFEERGGGAPYVTRPRFEERGGGVCFSDAERSRIFDEMKMVRHDGEECCVHTVLPKGCSRGEAACKFVHPPANSAAAKELGELAKKRSAV